MAIFQGICGTSDKDYCKRSQHQLLFCEDITSFILSTCVKVFSSFFSHRNDRICARVFKLWEPVITVTRLWGKPNAASACRLAQSCWKWTSSEGSLPTDSVAVGREWNDRKPAFSTTVEPTLLNKRDGHCLYRHHYPSLFTNLQHHLFQHSNGG